MTGAGLFDGLLHVAPADGPPHPDAYRLLRSRQDGGAIGPLVVRDDRLAALDLDHITLSVVVSSGAGSLTALARRAGTLPLVATETVLRDLDDLGGNAARVVAAAADLDDGVDVYVGISSGRGTVDAVEVVEAAGLLGRVDLSGDGGVDLLSVLVEADLPFKVTGLRPEPFGPYGLAGVLMAVEALVDGAEAADAERLVAAPDRDRSLAALGRWDGHTRTRVRRRVLGVDCTDARATLGALADAGLLSGS